MTQLSEHIHELAEVIGPRPATTDAEAVAADYIQHQFESYELEVERQEFECQRTDSWAFAIYHVLIIGAVVLAKWAAWPALAIALLAAVVMLSELRSHRGVSRILSKGPSQNVIGRHVPRLRRGEHARRVVIVAHYDSPKSSSAFSPGMVKNLPLIGFLMRWATYLAPVVLLVNALPLTRGWRPYTWYVALAFGAVLLVPLFFELQRELAGHATDGANDNASGVAAMLGVLANTVPESDDRRMGVEPAHRGAEAAYAADVVPDDAVFEYTPSARPAPAPVRQTPPAQVLPEEDDDIDAGSYYAARAARSTGYGDVDELDEPFADAPDLDSAPLEEDDAAPAPRRRWPWSKRKKDAGRKGGVRDWLGVEGDFDARKEGATLGTWEHLADDDDDEDGFGFKGGMAGQLGFEDPDFAAEEASRIRRRVTSGVDRSLSEKEVWFVATGAGDAGGCGMRAFLNEYAEDLRSALIINLECVGAGTLSWVTAENAGHRYRADRRLSSTARRVAREADLPIQPHEYSGTSTDATQALVSGFKAMSVMAFDINGRIPNWHWHTDTADTVSEPSLELAATFVTELIKAL